MSQRDKQGIITGSSQRKRQSQHEQDYIEYKCYCGKTLNRALKPECGRHIKNCQEFLENFEPAGQFQAILDQQIHSIEDNDILRIYAQTTCVDKHDELKQKSQKNKINEERFNSQHSNLPNNLGNYVIENSNAFPIEYPADSIGKCQICAENLQIEFIFLECDHLYCLNCIKKAIDGYHQLDQTAKCIISECKLEISPNDLIEILGNEKYLKLQEECLLKDDNMVSCVKCSESYYLVPGSQTKGDSKKTGNDGIELTCSQQNAYAKDRYKCYNENCKTEQCVKCKATPYHTMLTCQQAAIQYKCRYCNEALDDVPNVSENPRSDTCIDPDCCEKYLKACEKILQCGHRCGGIKEDDIHRCTYQGCDGTAKNDRCLYCLENLLKGPCVYSAACEHSYHETCLKNCLGKKFSTKRMNFNYLKCPNCRKEIDIRERCQQKELLDENFQKKQEFEKLVQERFKNDDGMKNNLLKEKDSKFYKNPQEQANSIYAVYICFKCKGPFIGGMINCENEADLERPNGGEAFNGKDYICQKCSGQDVDNCSLHGDKYKNYKCKYCCNVAVWFCFGTTHFCDNCHSNNRQKKKCPGPGKCPINNGNHQPGKSGHYSWCALCL